MIPTGTYRPFGRRSPRLGELDVAKLINRTVEWAVRNKRELGFAAVNVGCDGVQRTTMFDGSSCQVEGEVCIAERQDGISACLQAPTQGNGLTLASLVFSAPVCEPVTGWWIVDAEGYMYKVPQSLITAGSYWPMSLATSADVTIARLKTWAVLMCAADLVIQIEGGGGSEWQNVGEFPGVWTQRHAALLGGDESGWLGDVEAVTPSVKGLLYRDAAAPNAGARQAGVTIPPPPAEITERASVGYGYPFAVNGDSVVGMSGDAPGTRARSDPPPGTVEIDCVGRYAGDMALVYRRGLMVEYESGHINLDGAAITDLGDFVSSAELDYEHGPALDVSNVNVLALPNGEVAVFAGDLRSAQRYRVRAAPVSAPAVALIQQAKGAWGVDPNLFIEETDYAVFPWADGATTFTVLEDLTALTAPGRGVAVVLWEKSSGVDNYLGAANAYYGTLGETTGGLTAIEFEVGTVVVASTAATLRLTVIGPQAALVYGWTAEDENGIETALSPLVRVEDPPGPLYTPEITVPGGATGTTKRHVYRLMWDHHSTLVGGPYNVVGPWAYSSYEGGADGAVYDRMMRRVATHVSTLAEPGTDPIVILDDDTSLSTSGTRPPSPLIYVGPLTVDAPHSVHLLQPMNL